MMLTEKEAREKWCPFSKPAEGDKCIASDCMFWRENSAYNIGMEDRSIKQGYCGAGGKPSW